MVDQEQAEEVAAIEGVQQAREGVELILSHPTGGEPWGGGNGRADIDDRDRATFAQAGEDRIGAVAQPLAPGRETFGGVPRHEGVVIAGADGDVAGIAERLQPGAGGLELGGGGEVDEVAGEGDVIGAVGANIVGEGPQNLRLMLWPLASPGEGAQSPLGEDVGARQRIGRRLQMRVGQVREAKGRQGGDGF